jgi:hypothetical protein
LSVAPPWEAFLAERFPGYLLPRSWRRALPEEAAARFLERLGGRPEQLLLLRAAGLVSRRSEEIQELALRQLPSLARGLPPRAATARQAWEGRAPGRPDVAATLRCHLEGRRSRFVTHGAVRAFDRPENVLAKAVARRLCGVLGMLGKAGWGRELAGCIDELNRLLEASPLGEIPDEPITGIHEQAALGARHPAYALSARLHRALREGLDEADPAAIARVLAEGALAPLSAPARFELAVLIRLIEAIEGRLEQRGGGPSGGPRCWRTGGRWRISRAPEGSTCAFITIKRAFRRGRMIPGSAGISGTQGDCGRT